MQVGEYAHLIIRYYPRKIILMVAHICIYFFSVLQATEQLHATFHGNKNIYNGNLQLVNFFVNAVITQCQQW